jgi:hypothetical protein
VRRKGRKLGAPTIMGGGGVPGRGYRWEELKGMYTCTRFFYCATKRRKTKRRKTKSRISKRRITKGRKLQKVELQNVKLQNVENYKR